MRIQVGSSKGFYLPRLPGNELYKVGCLFQSGVIIKMDILGPDGFPLLVIVWFVHIGGVEHKTPDTRQIKPLMRIKILCQQGS